MNGTVFLEINSQCKRQRYDENSQDNSNQCWTEDKPSINIHTCPRHRSESGTTTVKRCIQTITFNPLPDHPLLEYIRFDLSNSQLVSKMSIQEIEPGKISPRIEVHGQKDFKKIHRRLWKPPLSRVFEFILQIRYIIGLSYIDSKILIRIKIEAESPTEIDIELSYFYVEHQNLNSDVEEWFFCFKI